jgi:drug/metabolite transporter (DMT)-like permease
MLWLVFALISAFLRGLDDVVHRFVMREQVHRPVHYAFIFNVLCIFVFLPFALADFRLPSELVPWILLAGSCLIYTVLNIIAFYAYRVTEVTILSPLTNARVLLVFLLALAFLGEAFTMSKLAGTLFIFLGVVLLTWSGGLFRRFRERGVQLVMVTVLFSSFVSLIDKVAVQYFSAGVYGLLVWLIPAMILGVIAYRELPKLKHTITKRLHYILLASIFISFAYFFELTAYKLPGAQISLIFPILRLSPLVSTTLGIALLGERKELGRRILGALVMIAGAVAISV